MLSKQYHNMRSFIIGDVIILNERINFFFYAKFHFQKKSNLKIAKLITIRFA